MSDKDDQTFPEQPEKGKRIPIFLGEAAPFNGFILDNGALCEQIKEHAGAIGELVEELTTRKSFQSFQNQRE